jgi:D-alanine-D-alanine ligase
VGLNGVKVVVLGGGVSGEREVSLESSKNAWGSLKRSGVDAVLLDVNTTEEKNLIEMIKNTGANLAFIALHGEFGEDGAIQTILESIALPHTGSGPKASYDAMDKIRAKEIFIKMGIPTPRYEVATMRDYRFTGAYPVVVKPFFSGSSLGVSIVKEPGQLPAAIGEALKYKGSKALIEEYIEGRELTVGILGEAALEVVEIVPHSGFYDFSNKYSDGVTDFLAPAPLDETTRKELKSLALRAHLALGCRHFSRVDIRLNNKKVPYVLEVNSIPGLTSHSLLPLSAGCLGISYDELILRMTRLAWSTHTNNRAAHG